MAITAEARTDIIALVVGMFDAAPGATFLSQFVNAVDAGATIDTLAADLAGTAAFKGIYPDLQTSNEFATKFVDNIAPEAGTAAKAWAVTWIEAQLNGGATKAEVIAASITALRATDEADANWGNAAAALNNKVEVAEWYSVDQLGNATDLASLQNTISTVTSDNTTVTDITSGSAQSGDTFTLTTSVDTITGTAANDSIVALIDGADDTLNSLDSIDGGAGTDTMTLNLVGNVAAIPAGVTIQNVETIDVRSSGNIGTVGVNDLVNDATDDDDATASAAFDVSGVTGLNDLNVTLASNVSVDAATTTDVTISGVTGGIEVDGGKDVSITDATADNNITVGSNVALAADNTNTAGTAAAGTISVTDSNQGSGVTQVDGGTEVTVTASGVTTGTTTVGALDAASGSVTVSATAADRNDNADLTMGAIAVTGGTTVDVTVSAGSTDASEFATGTTITQSAVTVTGDDSTTSVTVTQDAVVAEDTYTAATAGVAQVKTVQFVAMTAGSTMTVDSLVFTAAKALTAEEVAAAFANMTASETQTTGGPTANGSFTGATSANWTSGAADGDTVTFTEVTPTTADTALAAVYSAGTNPTVTEVNAGVTAVALNAGVLGVTGGAAVVVDQDGADATITTITLDGYGAASDIQGADALTTLNLSNSAQGIDVDAAVETLTVNLDNITGAAVLDLDDEGGANNATLTTVNIALASDSTADIIADAATDLNVSGTGTLTTSAAATDLALVDTVTVSGAAGLVLTGTDATVLANIDASGTSGDVTATIDSGIAAADTVAYAGGTGTDTVTLTADTTVDGDISLGDGDDELTLTASTTAITGTVTGGAGTDTISMDTTSAEALDDDNDLTNLSGFERLDLTAADGGESIDVDTMGFDYVTVSAVADDGGNVDEDFELILQNNSTVVLTGAIGLLADDDTLTATVTDAATTDATLNLVADVSDATINFGTAVANDVETINLTAQGVFTDADEDGVDDTADIATLDVTADAVTSITIDGDADLTLTATATTVTTVNASALTGDLTYTADDGTVTVTGGTGDDALTAAGSGDTLLGGAGNDTLTGANLTTLTGGEGNDTFVLNVPTSVVTYSTITDLSAGDTIQLTATESFVSAELTYANTASFQDVVNLAVNTLAGDDEDAAWFQFGGNTYVVQNDDRTEDTDTDFENGIDGIIEITGLVDLSTASYSQTNGTLEIV